MASFAELGRSIGQAASEPMRAKVALKKQSEEDQKEKEKEQYLKQFAKSMGQKYGSDIEAGILAGESFSGLMNVKLGEKRISLAGAELKLKKDQIEKLRKDTEEFSNFVGEKYGDDYAKAVRTGNFKIFKDIKSEEAGLERSKKFQELTNYLRDQGQEIDALGIEAGLKPSQIKALKSRKTASSWKDITPDIANETMQSFYESATKTIGDGLNNMGEQQNFSVNSAKLDAHQALAEQKAIKLSKLYNSEEFSNVLSFYNQNLRDLNPSQLQQLDTSFVNDLKMRVGDYIEEYQEILNKPMDGSLSMSKGIPDLKNLKNNMIASAMMAGAMEKDNLTIDQIKDAIDTKMNFFTGVLDNFSAKDIEDTFIDGFKRGEYQDIPDQDKRIILGIHTLKVFKEEYMTKDDK